MASNGAKESHLFCKQDILFFLLFLIIFLFMFKEFFFTRSTIYERDTTAIEIPTRKLCAQLLKDGNFALWTDDYGQGQPFLANPKNAIFYPTTLLYLILPLFTAFKLHYFIHAIIAWLGLYYLCRSMSLSCRGSFFGASLFIFGGMYLSSFEFYNHIAALAWMPWILVILLSRLKKFIPSLFLLAVFWALMILAGTPEALIITGFLIIILFVFNKENRMRKLAQVFVAFFLALLITAAQLLPTLELLSQSERPAGISLIWPLEMIQIPNLVFPNFLGNDREPVHHDYWGWHIFDKKFPLYYSIYAGFAALILFFFGLKKPWDYRQRFLLTACALLFLLSNGRYSPFFAVFRHFPVLSLIRYPVKFLLGSLFSLSFLAAIGHDNLFIVKRAGKKGIWILSISAILTASLFWAFNGLIIGFLSRLFVIDQESSLRELALALKTGFIILTLVTAIIIVSFVYKIRSKTLSWAIIAVALLDVTYHNRFINPVIPASFYNPPKILSELKTPLRIYREEAYPPFLKEKTADDIKFLNYYRQSLYPFTGLGDGVRYNLNMDFFGLYSRGDLEIWRKAQEFSQQDLLKILETVGCQYRIGDKLRFSKDGLRIENEVIPFYIEKIEGKNLAPYPVFKTIQAESIDNKLSEFLDAGFNPFKTAIVGKEIILNNPAGLGGGEVAVLQETQGWGRYTATLQAPAIVVFPGNYRNGWNARIDGKKGRVFPVNLFSKGVVVATGTHEIILRYSPKSFRWGVMISLTAILFALVLVAGSIINRSKVRALRPNP